MTDEMIEEAVAREVHRLHPVSLVGVIAWKNLTLDERDECIIIAQGAIKVYKSALAKAGLGIRPREPTEEMIKHGHAAGMRKNAIWDLFSHEQALAIQSTFLPAAWQAMWDAHSDKPDG